MSRDIERPILFNGEMARAIRDGRKTQTRRPVKGWIFEGDESGCGWQPPSCPYGKPGDYLWGRETWASPAQGIVAYRSDAECGAWMGDGAGGRVWIRHGVILECEAYMTANFPATTYSLSKYGGRWRPSIHMPRWASRILLRVHAVRVESLQEMRDVDAIAEGIPQPDPSDGRANVREFAARWDKIYGSSIYAWATNPPVWVIEFEKADNWRYF